MVLLNKKYGLVMLACVFHLICHSQNMVINPSFEKFETCPVKLGNLNEDVVHWSTPTIGSTDYFHSCSNYMGTPKNFNGVQEADFGSGYAGLYLYAPDDYREYVQASLTGPLVKGERYELSFYISLAERSDFAIREFGVLFSDKPLKFDTKKNLSRKVRYSASDIRYNYIKIPDKEFYRDTEDWVEVRTAFTAQGTERFMTLGNFENNASTLKTKRKRQAKQGAYYYLDLVSLRGPEGFNSTVNTESKDLDEHKETYTLDAEHTFENVLFEFDRYQLSEAAKQEVKQVYEYLRQHPDYTITVHGHTDNVGTSRYNQGLSESRCKAVTEHLLRLGLSSSRVSWVGQGGSSPIASNDTEVGRRQNRRVVFVLTRK